MVCFLRLMLTVCVLEGEVVALPALLVPHDATLALDLKPGMQCPRGGTVGVGSPG